MDSTLILVVVLCFTIYEVQGMNPTQKAKELKKTLSKDYDSNTLPSQKTEVEITHLIVQDFLMRESSHEVQISALVGMNWLDDRLKWKPEENDGITELSYQRWDIWRPDINLKNAATIWSQFLWAYDPLRVTSDGKVNYFAMYSLRFQCGFDMTKWPHDTHNCSIVLRSWTHGVSNIDFTLKVNPKIDLRAKKAGDVDIRDWDVSDLMMTKSQNKYPCCNDPFTEITTAMMFTRRGPALVWTVKIPVVCLCFLTMVVFLLPPDAGEKFVVGGLNVLFNGLFLATLDATIMASPSHTPLLVQMAAQQLLLATISIIVASAVFRISKDPHSTGLPVFLKGPVLGLSRLLLLGNYTDLVSSSHKSFTWTMQGDQVELADDNPAAVREREAKEWVLLGAVIDRIVFLLYFIVCLITFIRFSSVL